MDVFDALKALFEEKRRVEKLIATLEAKQRLQAGLPVRKRRGRISMGSEERRQVSDRMRRYWEKRRRAAAAAAAA
jgi:hypothetical protein